MRYNRVFLISPPAPSRYGGLRVPANVGHIAQALHDAGIEHEFLDMRIGGSRRRLQKRLLAFQPDLIGLSMITLGYLHTYGIIEELKRLLPKAHVVVGGHHTTILKEEVLAECPQIDYGVVADGENVIVELCDGKIPVEEVKGLIYREGPRTVFTGERPLLKNLDEYAFPRYLDFNMKDYSRQIPIHSSRGCVFQCTFCPNKLLGRRYREKSVSYFIDEIEHWYARGYRQFAIDDDNFTLKQDRVYAVCDELENRRLTGLFIRCSNGIRADKVDRRLLERMSEVGVREVGFGVDGGNDRVLQSVKKGESIETIERAIKYACEVGLDVKLFILTGTPHETREDIEDSIRLARKYPIARVNFNNPIPYPGTEMYDYIKENNLFVIPPEKYLNDIAEDKGTPVFETPALSAAERAAILKRCHQVENEVMKNTLARMFGNSPLAGFFARHLFNVTLFEKLFFKNLLLRKLFERIRYRKLLQHTS